MSADEDGNMAASSFLYGGALVLAVLWLVRRIAFATQSRWFPWVMHMCTKDIFYPVEEVKKNFFASMSSIVSHDPELRKNNSIRILEIGVGTGVNFAHYPEGTNVVVVDPNPNFKTYYNNNRNKFSHIHAEDIIVTTGDKMDMIMDNSVDVVVVTLVLCSVKDIDAVLREIRRVLTVGGKFYFMEHVTEFDLKKHWWRRQFQDVFTNWIGVWPFIFDGCCLNREILPNIERAGFSSLDVEKYYAPVPNAFFYLERPNIKGVATK